MEVPRHLLQHGRGLTYGADIGKALRQLVGLPFGRLGHQRAALWATRIGHQFPHNYPFGLPINAKGERHGDRAQHSHTYAVWR
jgi:hypothetical protein